MSNINKLNYRGLRGLGSWLILTMALANIYTVDSVVVANYWQPIKSWSAAAKLYIDY